MKGKRITAVLRRRIPVEPGSDTCVFLCDSVTKTDDIVEWADRLCQGNAHMVSLEIVPADVPENGGVE